MGRGVHVLYVRNKRAYTGHRDAALNDETGKTISDDKGNNSNGGGMVGKMW